MSVPPGQKSPLTINKGPTKTDFNVLCTVYHNYNFIRFNLNLCKDVLSKSSSEETLVNFIRAMLIESPNFICYRKRKYYNSNKSCRTKISKPFNSIVDHPKLNWRGSLDAHHSVATCVRSCLSVLSL